MKCDKCGRFSKRLHDVWAGGAYPEYDYAECDRCREIRLKSRDSRLKAGHD